MLSLMLTLITHGVWSQNATLRIAVSSVPDCNGSSPTMALSSDDFPQPTRPTTIDRLPSSISKLMSCKTFLASPTENVASVNFNKMPSGRLTVFAIVASSCPSVRVFPGDAAWWASRAEESMDDAEARKAADWRGSTLGEELRKTCRREKHPITPKSCIMDTRMWMMGVDAMVMMEREVNAPATLRPPSDFVQNIAARMTTTGVMAWDAAAGPVISTYSSSTGFP